MLIEFKVGNYLSFKDETVLSMVASSDKDSLPNNVIEPEGNFKHRLLKSAVIYGANASGKSNLIKAISFMKEFVRASVSGDHNSQIDVTPFIFDETCKQSPSLFEVDFLCKGIRYVYGFRVDKEKVYEEWLYSYPKGKQVLISERALVDKQEKKYDYRINRSQSKLNDFREKTRHNSLFLTVAAQFNNEMTVNINEWFSSKFLSIRQRNSPFQNVITNMFILENDHFKNIVIDFLKKADFGISNVNMIENEPLIKIDKLNKEEAIILDILDKSGNNDEQFLLDELQRQSKLELSFSHIIRNDLGENQECPLDFKYESDGTHRFYTLIGEFLFLIHSSIIKFADELDLQLHPMLTRWLIDFFHNNDKVFSSQLIFTTHNSDIMDPKLFRRDQIWFATKDRSTGASSLFSLSDYKRRKGENHRKNYLEGRYGAIPILEKFDNLELKEENR